MNSSAEYRQYMHECLRAAAKAKSAEERKSFLQLAQTWHRAATNLETSDKVVGETPDDRLQIMKQLAAFERARREQNE